MKKYSIGVDIGGSHISCAVVDIKNEKIIVESFVEANINNKKSGTEILKGWADELKKCISFIDKELLAGIGFGMPGPFEYATGIGRFAKVEKFYGLNGVNVALGLSKLLNLSPNIPLRFMNDASAFAVGESWLGSTKNHTKSISITLGTGFGSAFIMNGIPVVEGETVPPNGCVWHLPYKKSIANDYFSTHWFVKRFKEETGIDAKGVKQITEYVSKIPATKTIFEEFGQNMGDFLSEWLLKFSADTLVVGGNISGAYHLFGESLKKSLIANKVNSEIKISLLKENAAIIGSARMLDPIFWNKIKPILSKM